MEAPTTSAASGVTLISPKRAVMIDHQGEAVLEELVDARPQQAVRQSRPARVRAGTERPATCSSCQVTYLPAAVPGLAVVPDDWVCDRCRDPHHDPEMTTAPS